MKAQALALVCVSCLEEVRLIIPTEGEVTDLPAHECKADAQAS